MIPTVSALLRGSSGSKGPGLPVGTLQKRHARVQTPPMTMSVAVPLRRPSLPGAWPPDQHSLRFGQRADSHTVESPRSRRACLMALYCSPAGGRILNHSGRRRPGELGAAPPDIGRDGRAAGPVTTPSSLGPGLKVAL